MNNPTRPGIYRVNLNHPAAHEGATGHRTTEFLRWTGTAWIQADNTRVESERIAGWSPLPEPVHPLYDDAKAFLQAKDVCHHPRITDRKNFDVAELLAEFAGQAKPVKKTEDWTTWTTEHDNGDYQIISKMCSIMPGTKDWALILEYHESFVAFQISDATVGWEIIQKLAELMGGDPDQSRNSRILQARDGAEGKELLNFVTRKRLIDTH